MIVFTGTCIYEKFAYSGRSLRNGYVENTMGKREIAISSFPIVFSTLLETFEPFSQDLKLSFANSFSLGESMKFVVWEKVKPAFLEYGPVIFL